MRKVFVIGIDGMDADFVADHIDEMPNFRKLRDRGFGGGLRSVFPTDSIPAWITIFTAIPPVEHGLLDAIDYFKKDHKDFAVDLSTFKGRTFWDVASEAGLRCCILNPFMAYPPWDINGIMASGPVFVDEEGGLVTPESMTASYPPPDLGGIVDFPTKEKMGEFVIESRQYTMAQHQYGLRLLDEEGPFDLYFSTYLTLDRMQHFLWRYHDREDPTWPGPNDHQSAVLDAYLMFDDILGDYIERAGEDTDIIVILDQIAVRLGVLVEGQQAIGVVLVDLVSSVTATAGSRGRTGDDGRHVRHVPVAVPLERRGQLAGQRLLPTEIRDPGVEPRGVQNALWDRNL